MSDVKWIKIPTNIFDYKSIEILDDESVVLYFRLLCKAYKKRKNGVFNIANIILTDDILESVFFTDNIGIKLKNLEDLGLIIRNEKDIQVIRPWIEVRDRNTTEYKNWRLQVFKRDNFTCKKCGNKKDIQAHHIEGWKDNKDKRYVVSNGITLCRKCHLEAHNGRWY